MNKKIIVSIITIMIMILGYIQVKPLYKNTPSENFKPINISEANLNKQDKNMALSFLYNISKYKHPTGSDDIHKVRDYIISCLEQINTKYTIQTRNLDENFFTEIKNDTRIKLNGIKNDYYEMIKKQTQDGNVDSFIKNNSDYNSFDEFYNNEIAQGKSIEETLEHTYNERLEKYNGQTLTNILVSLSQYEKKNTQNILFVAHYDSTKDSYGASDDGMAVAGLLETIRLLNNKNFENNIYVLFTDGEEENFWGANEFIKNNTIKYDLIINFDNSGSNGHLLLYHYSNDNIAKQTFKAISKESSYSLTNDILYNHESNFYQGEASDAFLFIKNGYTVLDFALSSTPYNYHSENDSFKNISIDSLNDMTTSMIEMVNYYGNNNVEIATNEKFINFKIITGFELSLKQSIYNVISVILIIISICYIFIMFKKKDKVIKKIFSIILSIISILVLVLFKQLSILSIIPVIIMLLADFIKDEKKKTVFKIIAFELYLFIMVQLLVPLIEYLIWVTQLWGKG